MKKKEWKEIQHERSIEKEEENAYPSSNLTCNVSTGNNHE
jgi:hypothetical protein